MLIDMNSPGEMSTNSKRIAVIGLGHMGTALAAALLRSGASVRLWNRTAEKARPLEKLAGVTCGTAEEAISGSENVIVSLSDYPVWRSLIDSGDLKRDCSRRKTRTARRVAGIH